MIAALQRPSRRCSPARAAGTRRIWIVALMAWVTAACGPRALETVAVSGRVTYDGAPIANGSICFVNVDRRVAPQVLTITEGRYRGRVVVGDKRLEVRGMRQGEVSESAATGPQDGGTPGLRNFIPAAYNDASMLTHSLAGPGPIVIDLDLVAPR